MSCHFAVSEVDCCVVVKGGNVHFYNGILNFLLTFKSPNYQTTEALNPTLRISSALHYRSCISTDPYHKPLCRELAACKTPAVCTLSLGLFPSVFIFHMSDLKDRLLKSPDNSEWLVSKHIACNSCKSVFMVTANLYVFLLKEHCWHGTIKICGWLCVQWLTKCLCCY